MTIVPQHDATSCPVKCLDDGTWCCQAEIQNARGLHARAAARFVKLAETFDADVTVSNRGQVVSGRSIMGLMMLAASLGTTIELRASGPQAEGALQELLQLINAKFHED